MARTTLTKHVARRQEQTFADWCVEVRDLAGERWPVFQTKPQRSMRFGEAARRRNKPSTWLGSFCRRKPQPLDVARRPSSPGLDRL
jgi:hypothetical protein